MGQTNNNEINYEKMKKENFWMNTLLIGTIVVLTLIVKHSM
ncbi:hypothetical protein [Alkalihalobacillus trypoxylicola]|nr:hypothetical protein [Alkalihalobacillus trypoxylicola]GAF63531.1 hypothetical protein BTS2_0422 [Bacillus sp. TS-2]